ncbi:hypothetical protein [Paenibacillus contaminans]|uniref:hypothetical protein n=1 Tax=Paenibacillus contaminans TaxID=450362 RepID=UPI0011BF0145|nr:hypothetical protein [Paenibacillus contaminans]
MLESENARLEQGIEARVTLESDFTGLENGFIDVPSKIPAASRRFRTTGGERQPLAAASRRFRTTGGERQPLAAASRRFRTTGRESKPLAAASRRFRTTGVEMKPYSNSNGLNRTAAHTSGERGSAIG